MSTVYWFVYCLLVCLLSTRYWFVYCLLVCLLSTSPINDADTSWGHFALRDGRRVKRALDAAVYPGWAPSPAPCLEGLSCVCVCFVTFVPEEHVSRKIVCMCVFCDSWHFVGVGNDPKRGLMTDHDLVIYKILSCRLWGVVQHLYIVGQIQHVGNMCYCTPPTGHQELDRSDEEYICLEWSRSWRSRSYRSSADVWSVLLAPRSPEI